MSSPADPTETAQLVSDVDNKFKDEPKEGKDVEDPVFANDKGDGTASLMKPTRPSIHKHGRDIRYDIDGNRIGSKGEILEKVDENSILKDFGATKWEIVSSVIFVFASVLYLAMACQVMDVYWWYRDIPRFVTYADDDTTWWNYFLNCTDDEYIPINVTRASDDYTWYEWYNNTFPDDDTVWVTDLGSERSTEFERSITKYMILYFWAAFSFVIVGIIQMHLTRNAPFKTRVLYYLMTVAASFGLASAILTNKSPLWSNITNCISVNLWALEAIFIVLQRLNGDHDANEYKKTNSILCCGIHSWLWIADISFLFGTLGDAISSYFYFRWDNYIIAILAIIFAAAWLLCAFAYLAVAIYDYKQFKEYFDVLEAYELELKEMETKSGDEVKALPAKGSAKDVTEQSGSSPPSSNNDPPDDEAKKMSDVENNQAGIIQKSDTGDLADSALCGC